MDHNTVAILSLEAMILMSDSAIPEGLSFLPSSLCEFEVLFYLRNVFPALVVLLRCIAEYLYVDVDATSIKVLNALVQYQKDLDSLLLQLQGLIEVSALESEDDKEERTTKITTISTRITNIRSQMEAANDHTAVAIHQLKVSSTNPGSQYYWILLVVMYGGVYLLN
eukprot:gene27737-34504_t